MTEEKRNNPGFQGSETSGAEVVIYTQEDDPVIFVGSRRERDPLIQVNGRKRQDVNPSLVSVSTTKEMGSASGKWQALIKPSAVNDNIFNRILDDDWVDISFIRHGRKWHTMRGLIDDVRKTTAVTGTGATTTAYQLTGRDFGKIFETTPIWFSIFSDDAISGGVSYKVFGGQTNIQGSPGQTVRGFLDGFLIELADSGRALWQLPSSMPGQRAETFVQSIKFDFDKFSNDPARLGLNPNFLMPQGTVWEMAQEWSDPLFHELFVDTLPKNPQSNEYTNEDTEFTVVFRDRPLPSIEDGPKNKKGKDGPWYSLPMHLIPSQAVVNMDVGRSGLDRFNAFFVAPQIAQEAVKAGAIDLYAPLWSKDDILRHGLRRFDITSKYTSLNAELLTLSSRLRTRVRDWYCINSYLLNGNISFGVGLPNIRIGNRLKILSPRGPDFDHTYYVESVSNNWAFGQGLKTSTGVTRGWIGTEDSYLEALEVLIIQYSVPVKKDPDNA